MAEIPEKPYYKLNEVCQFTDTQPYVLRFWESEFPQLSPEKSRSGQPIYRRRDIDLVLRIKRLLQEEEQSISVAREILETDADGVPLASVSEPAAREKREPAEPPEPFARTAVGRTPDRISDESRARDHAVDDDDEASAHQESLEFDAVPRHRYDDAVDEIQHLKLELSDAEQRAKKADATARKLEEANQRLRERNHRAAAILEELIDEIS